MTPRSLFNIVLKIFGSFFLREIIYTIPQLVSSISYFTKSAPLLKEQSYNNGLLTFALTILIILFYSLMIYFFVFKANNLIDRLKLDKGFDKEEFSFTISTAQILTIALIVIGGVILTNEIPNFCRSVFAYFQEKSLTHGMTKPNYSYIIVSAVKIILGLLIIGERKRIVEFAEKRQAKNQGKNIDGDLDSIT